MKTKRELVRFSGKYHTVGELPQWLALRQAVSRQLKLMRKALGMTQVQLAKRVHGEQMMLSRVENESVDPRLSTLKKIAEGLNCELLIQLVPKEDIAAFIDKKAEEKAREIIELSVANAAMESQKPPSDLIEEQVEELKKQIMTKHRDVLWREN